MKHTDISLIWLLSLNFAKGVPYVIVMVISLLMFRQMGLCPAVVTLLVGLCYLPWVLKFWWKSYVERVLSVRQWVVFTQLLLSLLFSALAFAFPSVWLVAVLLVATAWVTAIHNVAADRLSAQTDKKSRHLLARELSRKFAVVVGQGVLVMLAGNLQVFYRNDMLYAWRLMFYLVAGLYLLMFFWHTLVLPAALPVSLKSSVAASLSSSLVLFFFCYPLAQAMIAKVSILFLTATSSNGGLGLSPQEFGLVMGTVGIVALTVGGLWGAGTVHRLGTERCLWPMALSMLVPGFVYTLLSYFQPRDLMIVSIAVLTEQLAYGFGFALYLWLLRQIVWRELGKSVMALSMMIGCALSGVLLQFMGYNAFFVLMLGLGALSPLSLLLLRGFPIKE